MRMRPFRADQRAFALVLLLSLGIELLLIDRKFGIFSGGFGQPLALKSAGDILLFLAASASAHIIVLGLLYLVFARLFPSPTQGAERLFSFAYLGAGGFLAALSIRLELVRYFSDAVSFQLFQNLGGGSIVTAFLYAGQESMTPLSIGIVAIVTYAILLSLLRRQPRPSRPHSPKLTITASTCLLIGAATLGLCFAANQDPATRGAAGRMTAFASMTALLHEATDFDRDGYSLFSSQIDRQPFDPKRHPYALDVPGNGLDEDGLAGDLKDNRIVATPGLPPLPQKKRHLVLIVLESTRFDALGKVINGRPVMPNLEILARQGSSFRNAYSHAGFTTPSVTSLLTGKLIPLPGDPSLYCDLRQAGYRVGVFSTMDENFGGIAKITGSRRCADVFFDARRLHNERAFAFASAGSLVVDESKIFSRFAKAYGKRANWQQPNFIYFNFQSPHFPYFHPEMTRHLVQRPLARDEIAPERRRDLAPTYYNAVAYADHWIGKVRDQLKALGVLQNTLLVVAADHGESLFENDFLGHGFRINDSQLHIPLVFSQPGLAQRGPIGLEDVRWLIGDALANRKPHRKAAPSFHYIGDIDRPSLIGRRETKGGFTIFDFDDRSVRFSENGVRHPYDTLPVDSVSRAQADALIRDWERRRWAAHVAASHR